MADNTTLTSAQGLTQTIGPAKAFLSTAPRDDYVATRIGVTLQRDADAEMGPGKYEIVRNPDIQPEEVAKHHSIPRAQRFNDKPDPDMVKRPVQYQPKSTWVTAAPHDDPSPLGSRTPRFKEVPSTTPGVGAYKVTAAPDTNMDYLKYTRTPAGFAAVAKNYKRNN